MTLPAYTVEQIAAICGGKLFTDNGSAGAVSDILIDSRRLIHPERSLFVALKSDRNDGHKYIGELYDKGVRSFMVSAIPERSVDASYILVDDTLRALQALGAFHRNRFDIPVIGITGSNGKTIVKEWLFQLLSPDFRIIRSPKSYNSQIGVPLSVWKMEPTHNLAIFEAGISRPGEMERLEPVIRPAIGIFTNIGHAHDEHFQGLEQKVKEKLTLFRHAGMLIYCSDQELIGQILASDPAYRSLKTFTWGRREGSDMRLTRVEKNAGHSRFTVQLKNREYTVNIPFSDDASVENAIHCLATGVVLAQLADDAGQKSLNHPIGSEGVDTSFSIFNFQFLIDTVLPRFAHLAPVAFRLELKEAVNHCSLINDYYNSDINSLIIALDFLNQQNQHQKKSVILSDILQSGRVREELYREIASMLEARNISRVIGIGRDMVRYSGFFGMEGRFFTTTDEFLQQFPLSSFQHETILLKGARIFEFEKISRQLQQKAHETVMEINLDALIHNLNHYRSRLRPGTRIMAMVKAFSYGSGSYEIANVLQFHHVDYLAVAYADEGVELRKAGIRLPILVMSPEEYSLDLLLKYNLEPEIYHFRILRLLIEAMEHNQSSVQDEVRIHLKLDTGMHRLGFLPGETEALIDLLHQNPGLRVQSVFTHLAASEDPSEDAFTLEQIDLFRSVSDRIRGALPYPVLRHVLNSAGINRFPEARFDMARLGIGLYGVGSDPTEQLMLRNVSTLKTVITQLKFISGGETVGYNRKGIVTRDSVIALIPVGYADGLNRKLGNGTGVIYIHGKPAPVIGNICMDLTMVDVTDLWNRHELDPQREALQIKEGDEAIVFNDAHPVSEIAAQLGTIPYEVLTGISRRVKRIYFYE